MRLDVVFFSGVQPAYAPAPIAQVPLKDASEETLVARQRERAASAAALAREVPLEDWTPPVVLRRPIRMPRAQ